MSEPLRPCPFCGNIPLVESATTHMRALIRCNTCTLRMVQSGMESMDSLFYRWNTRTALAGATPEEGAKETKHE